MSLSDLRKLTETGVEFRSHIDGSKHLLTPELSIEIQVMLGSDIIMAFDECPKIDRPANEVAESMEMSMRWARRSRDAFDTSEEHAAKSAIFGIQQGGLNEELRKVSAQKLTEIGFDGYAVGGLAVGEGQDNMFATLDFAVRQLPVGKPRYLMGLENRMIWLERSREASICLIAYFPLVLAEMDRLLRGVVHLISVTQSTPMTVLLWMNTAHVVCVRSIRALIYTTSKSPEKF